MDAIRAVYTSASSSASAASDSSSEGEEAAADAAAERSPPGETAIGAKRRREEEQPRPQWKRAFPHVDGQWPSHVRIGIAVDKRLQEHIAAVLSRARALVDDDMVLVPLVDRPEDGEDTPTELHLSLSRPFVLTYGQIDAFVDALRTALKWRKRFQISLGDALVLVNDDKTRSFLALRVEHGAAAFLQTLKCVDRCMALFRLQTYYEDPIPHVSIASTMGETLAQQLPADRLVQLNSNALRPPRGMAVTKVQAVIGNKHFEVPLT